MTASKSPQFRLQSLAIWADLVAPPSVPASLQGEQGADVLAAQEQATQARFSEVKVRLAADSQAMNRFNLEIERTAGKLHVAKVLHEKKDAARDRQEDP